VVVTGGEETLMVSRVMEAMVVTGGADTVVVVAGSTEAVVVTAANAMIARGLKRIMYIT
jgi:hypothetical protein